MKNNLETNLQTHQQVAIVTIVKHPYPKNWKFLIQWGWKSENNFLMTSLMLITCHMDHQYHYIIGPKSVILHARFYWWQNLNIKPHQRLFNLLWMWCSHYPQICINHWFMSCCNAPLGLTLSNGVLFYIWGRYFVPNELDKFIFQYAYHVVIAPYIEFSQQLLQEHPHFNTFFLPSFPHVESKVQLSIPVIPFATMLNTWNQLHCIGTFCLTIFHICLKKLFVLHYPDIKLNHHSCLFSLGITKVKILEYKQLLQHRHILQNCQILGQHGQVQWWISTFKYYFQESIVW